MEVYGTVTERSTFVVVANRLPVDEEVTPDGRRVAREPRRPRHGTAARWSRRGAAPGSAGAARPAPRREPFELDGIRLHPVALSADDIERFYEGQSNATIWPLYHDAVEPPIYSREWRDAYRVVNERFADCGRRRRRQGATVWVHDYQLQLVPAMLRARRPDLRIGFFLHIPFPPIELFMQMPLRAEILRGLLGADLVGFQQKLAAQNFVRLARHLLGLRYRGTTLDVGRTHRHGRGVSDLDRHEGDGGDRGRAGRSGAGEADPRRAG